MNAIPFLHSSLENVQEKKSEGVEKQHCLKSRALCSILYPKYSIKFSIALLIPITLLSLTFLGHLSWLYILD